MFYISSLHLLSDLRRHINDLMVQRHKPFPASAARDSDDLLFPLFSLLSQAGGQRGSCRLLTVCSVSRRIRVQRGRREKPWWLISLRFRAFSSQAGPACPDRCGDQGGQRLPVLSLSERLVGRPRRAMLSGEERDGGTSVPGRAVHGSPCGGEGRAEEGVRAWAQETSWLAGPRREQRLWEQTEVR